jgi:hypothetical protein
MKYFITFITLSALIAMGQIQAGQISYTEPVSSNGNNFIIISPGNDLIGGTNDVVFTWDGTLNTAVSDATSNATITSDEAFFGQLWHAHDVALYAPGTYTIFDGCPPGDAGCGIGNPVTFTVGPDQVGVHMLVDWLINTDIDVINIWNKNLPWAAENPASPFYTGLDNGFGCTPPIAGTCVIDGLPNTDATIFGFISTDVNGNGLPGHPMTDGPFTGFNANFNLSIGPPSPSIAVSIDVSGGTLQECTQTGGAPVSVSAEIMLFGGAELDTIEWTVNGSIVGMGESITSFLELGASTVEVLATTTTGESDNDSILVNVTDTVKPDLEVAFTDSRSGESISQIERANVQWMTAKYVAADACDPNPVTTGVGGFTVQNGDLLKIQGNLNTVTMTTSALELIATGTDASGNSNSGAAVLHITD